MYVEVSNAMIGTPNIGESASRTTAAMNGVVITTPDSEHEGCNGENVAQRNGGLASSGLYLTHGVLVMRQSYERGRYGTKIAGEGPLKHSRHPLAVDAFAASLH